MQIHLNTDGFAEIQQAIQQNEKAANIALQRSINKTAKHAQSQLTKKVSQTLALPQKKIREQISIRNASRNNPQATITVSRKSIRLIEYQPRQVKRGVSIRVKKGRPRKTIKSAFIATMRSEHRGVFIRERSTSLPIRELYGSAVIEVAQDFMDETAEIVQAKLLDIFRHEFEFAQQK